MANEIPTLEAQKREKIGTRYAARLREEGRLPAVIYGHKKDNVHVSVDAHTFNELLHESAHLVQIKLDQADEPCLIRDTQWDHLGSQIIHADFERIDLDETVTVEIELDFFGEPAALEEAGALLDHARTAIEIKCRAIDIPDNIRVDISGLTLENSITVADLQLPQGVTSTLEPDTLIAQISIQEEQPEEEVEGEGDQPEIIGREGEEEGEGEKEGA